jgi:hypothetical protein
MEQEIWKVVPSYPNYECSNLGRIRRVLNERVLKTKSSDIRGYQVVSIFTNKKKYTKKLARLVWEAFNDCACDKTIDHIDRNVMNDTIENLRCVSQAKNNENKGIYKKDNKYDLNDDKKRKIITNYRKGVWSTWDIMKIYNITPNYMQKVISRGSWDKLIWTNNTTNTEK